MVWHYSMVYNFQNNYLGIIQGSGTNVISFKTQKNKHMCIWHASKHTKYTTNLLFELSMKQKSLDQNLCGEKHILNWVEIWRGFMPRCYLKFNWKMFALKVFLQTSVTEYCFQDCKPFLSLEFKNSTNGLKNMFV